MPSNSIGGFTTKGNFWPMAIGVFLFLAWVFPPLGAFITELIVFIATRIGFLALGTNAGPVAVVAPVNYFTDPVIGFAGLALVIFFVMSGSKVKL